MEIDFLGLVSKKVIPEITIKDEADDVSKDTVQMKSSAMHWPFSNKVSASPQFLSFKPSPEEKSRKTIQDSPSSSGISRVSTADSFDSSPNPFSSPMQRTMMLDKQGSNSYTTGYSVQHLDASAIHRSHQMTNFSVSNQQSQSISVLQSPFGSSGHSVISNAINVQSIGGAPIISSVSAHPTPSSIVGTTDLRNGSKPSAAPAQLTIFYAGSVCVYDDISLEKAQAIMLLAGNGSSSTPNKMNTAAQVQAPVIRPPTRDGYVANKIHTASPCSALSSPVSLPVPGSLSFRAISIPGAISVTSSTNGLAKVKSIGDLASASNQTEIPKAVASVRPGSATLTPAVAVPQARKASLARFLEKRKERVTNTSPYNTSKKSPDLSSIGPETISLSINSFS